MAGDDDSFKLFSESGAVLGNDSRPADADFAAARARVALGNSIDQEDRADSQLAQQVLLEQFGTADYSQGTRLLRDHVAQLPEERQAALVSKGVERDPQALLDLVNEAMGPLPRTPRAIDVELAAARGRMANDKTWHSDDKAQLRYRALLRARGLA